MLHQARGQSGQYAGFGSRAALDASQSHVADELGLRLLPAELPHRRLQRLLKLRQQVEGIMDGYPDHPGPTGIGEESDFLGTQAHPRKSAAGVRSRFHEPAQVPSLHGAEENEREMKLLAPRPKDAP